MGERLRPWSPEIGHGTLQEALPKADSAGPWLEKTSFLLGWRPDAGGQAAWKQRAPGLSPPTSAAVVEPAAASPGDRNVNFLALPQPY